MQTQWQKSRTAVLATCGIRPSNEAFENTQSRLLLLADSAENALLRVPLVILRRQVTGRIKGSSSRFLSRKLERRQQITHVVRSSPSRSWVVYIMTTVEAHEFFR